MEKKIAKVTKNNDKLLFPHYWVAAGVLNLGTAALAQVLLSFPFLLFTDSISLLKGASTICGRRQKLFLLFFKIPFVEFSLLLRFSISISRPVQSLSAVRNRFDVSPTYFSLLQIRCSFSWSVALSPDDKKERKPALSVAAGNAIMIKFSPIYLFAYFTIYIFFGTISLRFLKTIWSRLKGASHAPTFNNPFSGF